MLKTTWGQNAPYNSLCPLAPGKNVHCKTGCVATAMAQVMKYYEYPEKGNGAVSYQYTGDDGLKHLNEVDFNKSAYDWKQMKNSYPASSSSSAAEENAVARIMADCGAAVEMQYGQYDSGAFEMDVEKALENYFSYDASAEYMTTLDDVSDSVWFCTLFQQISDGMPVIYGGCTESYLAHCFVVDGYNEEGKFHVVYGLGRSDGYVNLKEIAFRYGQSMTINIRPIKTPAGIKDQAIADKNAVETARYLLDGTRITSPQKGINIVRMSNGTTRKVYVR